jgi:hypothetical protein
LSFPRHKKIYQSDGLKRELNWSFSSLTDHRSDESSTGYSFMSCSPVELMSASPAPNSFSLNPCCCTVFSSQPQLSLFFAVSTEGSIPVTLLFCHLVVRHRAEVSFEVAQPPSEMQFNTQPGYFGLMRRPHTYSPHSWGFGG